MSQILEKITYSEWNSVEAKASHSSASQAGITGHGVVIKAEDPELIPDCVQSNTTETEYRDKQPFCSGRDLSVPDHKCQYSRERPQAASQYTRKPAKLERHGINDLQLRRRHQRLPSTGSLRLSGLANIRCTSPITRSANPPSQYDKSRNPRGE